jgi:hypothetical protein
MKRSRSLARPSRGLGIAIVISLCGCHQTISLGGDLQQAQRETTTSAATTTSLSDEGGSTSWETEDPVWETDDPPWESGGSTDSTSFGFESSTETLGTEGMGSDGETTGGLCTIDARDTECLSCVKTFCCPEAQSCNTDPDCACLLDCVAGPMPSGCTQGCEPNASASLLATCIAMSCPAACN